MRRGHLPGHEPLGVLRVPLLLAPLPGHERGWHGRRVRRHRWGFHRGRRRVRRRGRSATGVVHAGHASRSSRCVTTDVQRLIAGVACPRTPAFPTDCAMVWTDAVWAVRAGWIFGRGVVRRRRARARGSRRRWANERGFWVHEGVDATHAMCARRSRCATGSEPPPIADAFGGNFRNPAERWKWQKRDWSRSFVTGPPRETFEIIG